MSGLQLAFGFSISATAVLIFLSAVAGEVAIVTGLLDRLERKQERLLLEQCESAAQVEAD